MKRYLSVLMLCVCLILSAQEVQQAFAVESTLTEEQTIRNEEKVKLEKTRVYDYADLLTAEEEADLELRYYQWGLEADTDIILITTTDMEGKSDQVYLEDFQDELYFTQDVLAENASLMLINMEDRVVTIQGYGDCEFWLSNDRIEYILDWVYEGLVDGDYFAAAESFGEQTAYYMNQDKGVSTEYEPGQDYGEAYGGPSDYYGESLKEQYTLGEYLGMALSEGFLGSAVLGVVGSSIACLIIAVNRKPKNTVQASTYMDNQNSGLAAKRDDYLRTTVTKVRKPKESSGSSGGSSRSGGRSSGGGGRSSGGRSHSGGSRRF